MPHRSNLQHFKKGILLISQWTRTEYKNMEKVFLGIIFGPVEAGLIHVVWATLDFIYYAHFESHTLDLLQKMDDVWVVFYENLQYFIDEDIRDNFNIPKLHSTQHYTDSIISRGSVDSFSTKSPECLHIDFAKNTYQSTNKKNYLAQMTKWLDHQESCFQFAVYLQWTVKGYLSELEGTSEVREDDGDDEEVANEDDEEVSGEQAVFLGYTVAKTPAHRSIPLTNLVDQYGADDIISQLTTFLQHSSLTLQTAWLPSLNSTISVYKCLTVQLPPASQVTTAVTKDVVCAHPAVPTWGLVPAVPAQFNTVLA